MFSTTTTRRKASKVHRCFLCEQDIQVGQVYGRNCTFDGGTASTMKFHLACFDALYDMAEPYQLEEGILEGDLRQMLADDPHVDLSFITDEPERKRLEALRDELASAEKARWQRQGEGGWMFDDFEDLPELKAGTILEITVDPGALPVRFEDLTEKDLNMLRHMLGWQRRDQRHPPDGRDYGCPNPGDPLFARLESLGLVTCLARAGTGVYSDLDLFKTTDLGKEMARKSFYQRRKSKAARKYAVWQGITDAWPELTFKEFLTSDDPDLAKARRES